MPLSKGSMRRTPRRPSSFLSLIEFLLLVTAMGSALVWLLGRFFRE